MKDKFSLKIDSANLYKYKFNILDKMKQQMSTDQSEKFESILKEVLEENGILVDSINNMKKAAEECKFIVELNGDKIFYHLNKPLILFKEPGYERKEKDGNFTIEVIQEYKKLY